MPQATALQLIVSGSDKFGVDRAVRGSTVQCVQNDNGFSTFHPHVFSERLRGIRCWNDDIRFVFVL